MELKENNMRRFFKDSMVITIMLSIVMIFMALVIKVASANYITKDYALGDKHYSSALTCREKEKQPCFKPPEDFNIETSVWGDKEVTDYSSPVVEDTEVVKYTDDLHRNQILGTKVCVDPETSLVVDSEDSEIKCQRILSYNKKTIQTWVLSPEKVEAYDAKMAKKNMEKALADSQACGSSLAPQISGTFILEPQEEKIRIITALSPVNSALYLGYISEALTILEASSIQSDIKEKIKTLVKECQDG